MKIPTMAVPAFLKGAERLIGENAPTILTVAGVIGTITSTVMAARAGEAANEAVYAEVEKRNINRSSTERLTKNEDIKGKERAALVWKLYMPAAGVMTLACASTIGAQHINGKRLAALGAAYAISERNFDEYKSKVKEQLGITKEQKVTDAVAQDQVDAQPMSSATVYVTGNGEYPCFDRYTGRYFKSSQQSLEQAVNEINATLLRSDYLSLNDVYGRLGLDQTSHGGGMGWRVDGGLITLDFSTTRNDAGEPVLAFDFRPAPRPGYDMAH